MPDPNLNNKNETGLIVDYHPRLDAPKTGNKYYILKADGGWSDNIRPKNSISGLSALPNCVGYVNGRFNEIGEYNECRYPFINNPGTCILDAQNQGLKIGSEPQLGAVMVWTNSNSTNLSGLSGHVAIVEKIISDTEVITSESAYGGTYFYSMNRHKGSDGNWERHGYFRCFIYNPAVAGYASISTQVVDSGGAVTQEEAEDISQASSSLYKNGSIFTTELKQSEVTRDSIIQVDREYNDISSQSNNLLSYPSLVEAPYILVKIGDFVFGQYSEKRSAGKLYKTYPNFITALDVMKINGQVNVYTIKMLYQVQYMDDPNFVDKVLSSVGYGKIKISYGDFASPSFIYKEEEAIITKVTTNVDFSSSKIEYTISCTSSALSAQGTNFSFERQPKAKPSDIIYNILKQDEKYHLSSVFPGLTGNNLKKNFRKFIASDDLAVEIPAQQYMDPLSYINYLVSCMIPQEDTVSATTRSATYYMTIHDDSYADYSNVGGTYFKVTKIVSTYKTLPTFNIYSVDVGYPGGDHPGENLVMNFSLKDDNSWALLYDYSQSDIGGSQANYSYSINNQGQAVRSYSPNITQNAKYGKTTPSMKSWWTRMTEFPISATLTIKGLVRSAMLMTYLRVNTYFYGKKHVSSGLYVITKQEDRIDGSGYRTTLSLTRIAGEDEYIERKKYTQVSEVVTGIKKKDIPISEPVADEVMAHWGPAIHNDNEIVGYESDRYIVPAGMRLYVLTEKTADVNAIPPIYTNPNDQVFIDFMDGLYTGTDLNKFVVRPLLKGELDQDIYEEQFSYPFTEQQIIAHPVTVGGSKIFDPEGNLVSIAAANQYGMVQFEINGQVFFHPITYDALIDTEFDENWRTGQHLEKVSIESDRYRPG